MRTPCASAKPQARSASSVAEASSEEDAQRRFRRSKELCVPCQGAQRPHFFSPFLIAAGGTLKNLVNEVK